MIPSRYREIEKTQKEINEVLDKIKAEIETIAINGQVDEHTSFIRTGDQVKQMVLDIIDKYNTESEQKPKRCCKDCKW